MTQATVTSKGQLTIPRRIRETLRLRTGSRVRFRLTGPRSVEMESGGGSVTSVKGICRVASAKPVTVADMHRAIRKRGAAK